MVTVNLEPLTQVQDLVIQQNLKEFRKLYKIDIPQQSDFTLRRENLKGTRGKTREIRERNLKLGCRMQEDYSSFGKLVRTGRNKRIKQKQELNKTNENI